MRSPLAPIKRAIAALALTAAAGFAPLYAQNNIFPSLGFAGIGTINPAAYLHIQGQDGMSQYPSLLVDRGECEGGAEK